MIRKKGKNLWGIMLFCALAMLLLSGCGDGQDKVGIAEDIEAENIVEEDKEETAESDVSLDKDEESVGEDITYIEQNDIYLLSDACNDGNQIDLSSFDFDSKQYTLMDSVDIYYTDGTLAGYTKEDVSVYVISSNDEWSFCSFDTSGFLIKKNELLDSILVEENRTDDFVEIEQQEPIHFDATIKSDTENSTLETASAQESSTEIAVPTESSKYTPEEAIAVYRTAMEAGGITWDPGLKGVTSWGTGWIYLDKGQPEWCASTNLESFAMGDSGGNPWTKYYLEVTDSDENAVYITEWHN